MRLDKLLERLDYKVLQGTDQTEITTLINDSRKAEKGSVFVCISGAVSDGHSYAADVAAKGAAALVVEHNVDVPEDVTVILVKDTRYALALMSAAYFGYPAEKMKIIGITGTKGKTTTTYMIKSILDGVGHKVGLIGTIEAIIGEKHIPAANTTPESYTIHKYFAEMVEAGCDCVVMEVSSQGLMLHRTAGIPFEIGIFTNLGKDAVDGIMQIYNICDKQIFISYDKQDDCRPATKKILEDNCVLRLSTDNCELYGRSWDTEE